MNKNFAKIFLSRLSPRTNFDSYSNEDIIHDFCQVVSSMNLAAKGRHITPYVAKSFLAEISSGDRFDSHSSADVLHDFYTIVSEISQTRFDAGIPCGNGWISRSFTCHENRTTKTGKNQKRKTKSPVGKNPLADKLIEQAANGVGLVGVGAAVGAIAAGYYLGERAKQQKIKINEENYQKDRGKAYSHFSNRPDLIEQFTLKADPEAQRNKAKWKPEMTADQAKEWSKESAYPDTVYHLTSQWAAERIKEGGFLVPKERAVGRDRGNGVYLGTGEHAKTQLTNFYGELVGQGANETLEIKTNCNKLLDLGAVLEEAKKQDLYKNGVITGIESPSSVYGGLDLQLMRLTMMSSGQNEKFQNKLKRESQKGSESPEGIAFGEILQEMGYDGLVSATTKSNSHSIKKEHPGILLLFDPQKAVVVKNKEDISFNKSSNHDRKNINGKKLEATPFLDYSKVKQELPFSEPSFDYPVSGANRKSGVTVIEPDGRAWLMKVSGEYGGEKFSNPRGGSEPGLTDWQNAIKEAKEELGLDVKIVDFLGDFDHHTGKTATNKSKAVTRQYIGVRTGGAPWDAGSESAAVQLASLDSAKTLVQDNSRGDQIAITNQLQNYLTPNSLSKIKRHFEQQRQDSLNLIGIPCGNGWISPDKECRIQISQDKTKKGQSTRSKQVTVGVLGGLAAISVAGVAKAYFANSEKKNKSDIDTDFNLLPPELQERRKWYDIELQKISQDISKLGSQEEKNKKRHSQKPSRENWSKYRSSYLAVRTKSDDAFNLHFNKLADGFEVRRPSQIQPRDNRGRKVFISRHAAREDYTTPRYRPSRYNDNSLSENGILQAKEAGRSLKGKGITEIYASPFLRTLQTANEISKELNIPIRLEPGMAEWQNAGWHQRKPELLSPNQAKELFPTIDLTYESPYSINYPESSDDVLARSRDVAHYVTNHSKGNPLLVGHGPTVIGASRGLSNDHNIVLPQFNAISELEGTETGWAAKPLWHPSQHKLPDWYRIDSTRSFVFKDYRNDGCGCKTQNEMLQSGVFFLPSHIVEQLSVISELTIPSARSAIKIAIEAGFPEHILGLGGYTIKQEEGLTISGEFHSKQGVYGFKYQNGYIGYAWRREHTEPNIEINFDSESKPGYKWVENKRCKKGGYWRKDTKSKKQTDIDIISKRATQDTAPILSQWLQIIEEAIGKTDSLNDFNIDIFDRLEEIEFAEITKKSRLLSNLLGRDEAITNDTNS